MSDALMWANSLCGSLDLGQLGSFSFFFLLSWEGHRQALHTKSWSLSCLDPVTGTGHAPVELLRVQKGGQYSTCWDTKVVNWAQLQLFKISSSN